MHRQSAAALVALATLATALVFLRHVAWTRQSLSNIDFELVVCILLSLLVWAAHLGHDTADMADQFSEQNTLDTEAFAKLLALPSDARTLIVAPIDNLIRNATGKTSNSSDELQAVAEADYEEAKDPYVGRVVRTALVDPVGNQTVEDVYTLDPKLFGKMKLEYKRLDALLATLHRVAPDLYTRLLGSQPAGGAALAQQ
ncbi:hypothetical protein VOLCADRAFT_99760 [Volvox carteri f. nagariensis]|uniref:Uncharacterized protein n=1 Tax=Volvox carteri f. nagariensis TaxID=3068 RepID=D8UIK7_VOLCA|nr:uncharacterized protein VOLCADRAFT_99760 [Volvox carteri f. nagariensis]EFJ40411.1 hypothetical protein VOLCADRAFT_99760 [Volvox carteri f. nagariensis]|eukprot:XP_002958491.1 hypothetical protein VOLCADRAFT_99760 [Volvox carteri f. nagariensis]